MEGDYVFSLFGVLPYYILLAYVLMVYIGNLEKISQAKLCFWALFIFAAIRYGVAYDYMAYKSIILGDSREEELIRSIFDLIIDERDFDPVRFNNRVCATIACKASVRAKQKQTKTL